MDISSETPRNIPFRPSGKRNFSTACYPSWFSSRFSQSLQTNPGIVTHHTPQRHFSTLFPISCPLIVFYHNKNKLTVHMYIVKNTTIFLIVRLLLIRYNYMFRPSMLAIFRSYMKHLTISYIYTWVGGDLYFVGWGGSEISFCVCRRGVDRVCLGGVAKVSFMSLNNYIYK